MIDRFVICRFVITRVIYYRTLERAPATINYTYMCARPYFQCTPYPEAKYLIEALSLRKRAVSWGNDYDNLEGRFATRGRERERKSKKRVRISPAAEQGMDNKTLAGFTRRRINGSRSTL